MNEWIDENDAEERKDVRGLDARGLQRATLRAFIKVKCPWLCRGNPFPSPKAPFLPQATLNPLTFLSISQRKIDTSNKTTITPRSLLKKG